MPDFLRGISGKIILFFALAVLCFILTSCTHQQTTAAWSSVVDEVKDGLHTIKTELQTERKDFPLNVSASVPQQSKDHIKLGDPLSDFSTANFVGSYRCSMCHDKLFDGSGSDISISNHWRSTMMANSAKDPFWQAKVKSEVQRNPSLAKIIERNCVTCHMPMAMVQLNTNKKQFKFRGVNSLLDELLDQESQLHEAAMDGVSCSLCHQIQDSSLGLRESFNGNFAIDTKAIAPHRPIFGPYRETYAKTMEDTISFSPLHGPQTRDSALCATCHTVFIPYVDASGNIAGEFPGQTVYLEWLHSSYGEQPGVRHDIGYIEGEVRICQDCHMPLAQTGGVKIAIPATKEVTTKEHFSEHHFAGGNVFMMNILHDHIGPLKITASTEKINDTRKRSIDQLQNNSAQLFIRKATRSGSQLTTVIEVKNRAGHKFPTGFASRRAWIHLTLQDGLGEIVFESGKLQPDGSIAGDNSEAQKSYEPHYDLITQSDQIQIYESVMKDAQDLPTYTLFQGTGYLKDNRLLPAGFNKRTASSEVMVYGGADNDSNFSDGGDRVTYKIDITDMHGPFTLKAELLYTPISFAFMQDLIQDDHLPAVKRFQKHYDKADKAPVAVAASEILL